MILQILVLMISTHFGMSYSYFADWSVLARDRTPSCVNIPKNLSLCHKIGYTRMRLPNLLEHDTMQEVSHQAKSWLPLLSIHCHPDTKLFLCSLFAPVCLERTIYPCRSLCLAVKRGCEKTMKSYGFPWPSMLDCQKFPLDNDMCIAAMNGNGSANGKENHSELHKQEYKEIVRDIVVDEEKETKDPFMESIPCSSQTCNQEASFNNIINNFCKADFVMKIKFKKVKHRLLTGRKVKNVYKTWRGTPGELRKLRKPKLKLRPEDSCCSVWVKARRKRQNYLLMGSKVGEELVPSLILPWTKDRVLKRARRAFKQIDCSSYSKSNPNNAYESKS
ncbi:secreted frizzled-related protein 5 [Lepeophtheirus salmonis]|uniref:Secreted frizzledrelated protein 1/5 [Saccoglossus kowalevskii] n=1 Tax=Lepeophtheirus salmonis TaxID=72036 RepID=A0A0K2TNP2_LEPSM|nr:secreted frizzled-related protein 5-like [Lepeophtheirus salmonis]